MNGIQIAAEEGALWRPGACHCRAVCFEVKLAPRVEAHACNCSLCARTGFVHIIVPESRFRLLRGADHLTEYRFNTKVARHLFCRICGVKAFYRPRSNPDGWSVNARCLDDPAVLAIAISPFDGREWERHASALAPLSQEA